MRTANFELPRCSRAVDHSWRGWAIQGVVLVAMLALTWRCWPDAMIDFGRELYVPWRLTAGQTLYAEIAYHNGPLSPYLNATWFGVFGVSMSALFALNFLVLLGVLALLRVLLRDVTGAGGATLGGVAFLVLFAFGNYVQVSNYNWMSPYSHEMTHGIALSMLGLLFVRRFARGSGIAALFAGLAVGFVFLTKAEVFVAGFGAVACGLAVGGRVRRLPAGQIVRAASLFVVGCVAVPLVAYLLLLTAMDSVTALHGTFGTWNYVFDDTLRHQDFFNRTAGFDDVPGNLGRMLFAALLWGLVLLPVVVVARLPRSGVGIALGTALPYLLVAAVLQNHHFPIFDWLRPLPVVLLAILLIVDGRRVFTSRDPAVVTHAAWLVFSGLLLLKVALNVRVPHYGFGLAMPGTVFLFAFLHGPAVGWLQRRGGSLLTLRTGFLAVLAGVMACHVAAIGEMTSRKTTAVDANGDLFYAGVKGPPVNIAVEWIENNTPPDATLAVLVDGEILNYLSRRRNPLRFGNFNPQQMHLFGETVMRDAFAANPPDYLVYLHRDTSEYGPRFFGTDYGEKLHGWIAQNYTRAGLFDEVPFTTERPGILFLRRRR